MEPMVSIIVPVYNAEEYISRCVDSILNQEYKDFELTKKFAKYANIKLINYN